MPAKISGYNDEQLKHLLLKLLTPAPLRDPAIDVNYSPLWYNTPGISIAFNRHPQVGATAGSPTSDNDRSSATSIFQAQFGARLATAPSCHSNPEQNGQQTKPADDATSVAQDTSRKTDGGVRSDTVFQAASISKAILSLGVCVLLEQGQLASVHRSFAHHVSDEIMSEIAGNLVDRGIIGDLYVGLRLLRSITIIDLLGHASAVNVETFPGYPPKEEERGHLNLLSAQNIVAGCGDSSTCNGQQSPPKCFTTSPLIMPEGIHGLTVRYSGGGLMLLQLMIEEMLRARCDDEGEPKSFQHWMQALLNQLGMEHSCFTPSDGRIQDNRTIACGHHNASVPVTGGYQWHPELGAIGLWSTPTDLVQALLTIASILQSGQTKCSSSLPVSRTTLRQVFLLDEEDAQERNSYSMGFRIHKFTSSSREADRNKVMLSHRGCSVGYRCWAGVVVDLHDIASPPIALAIMTNSEEGDYIRDALILAMSCWLDEPFDAACQLRPIVPLAEAPEMLSADSKWSVEEYKNLCGTWLIEGQRPVPPFLATFSIDLEPCKSGLLVHFSRHMPMTLFKLHPTAFRGDADSRVFRVAGLYTVLKWTPSDASGESTLCLIQDGKTLHCSRIDGQQTAQKDD